MVIFSSLSSVGSILLNILYFIIALSLVVTIHELGHFGTAKLFGVYCEEFSIGFGPKLFSKKRKNGETYFSIRAIPLGGFVAMYGEAENAPDPSLNIPPERSLVGIKKWKRAIIMAAGIILNFVLAITLFVVNRCFCKQNFGTTQLLISEDSVASDAGLLSYDDVYQLALKPHINGEDLETQIFTVDDYYDIADNLAYTAPTTKDDTLTFIFYVERTDAAENVTKHEATVIIKAVATVSEQQDSVSLTWQDVQNDIGIDIYTFRDYLPFGRGLKQAFIDFKDSFLLIGKALGSLFIGKGFENLGGPIALFQQSALALEYGIGTFIYLWGAISVNLGIFNLLPFPGLDGWHLLVVAIEGITKKEIPNKVKSIVSMIGMILLFVLMGVVFIKDIINFGGIIGLL